MQLRLPKKSRAKKSFEGGYEMKTHQLILTWFNPFFGLNRWQAMKVDCIGDAYKWVRFIEKATDKPAQFAL